MRKIEINIGLYTALVFTLGAIIGGVSLLFLLAII